MEPVPARVETDGFVTIAGIISDGEICALADAFGDAALVRSRAGARHAMHIPAVARVARDARLLEIARSVLGPAAEPYRATLFDKSHASNWLVAWHQDTALPLRARRDVPGWGPWSEKAGILYAHAPSSALQSVLALRIHLDDSTASNGPLRVLPGTHRCGVLMDEAVKALVAQIQAVECLAARGDVLAMRPLLIHASSKARSAEPRRVLHIEYSACMQPGDGMELALA